MLFDTPSWCDGALTITPPTVEEVVEEVAAVVLVVSSVAVVAFFLPLTPLYDVLVVSPMVLKSSTVR